MSKFGKNAIVEFGKPSFNSGNVFVKLYTRKQARTEGVSERGKLKNVSARIFSTARAGMRRIIRTKHLKKISLKGGRKIVDSSVTERRRKIAFRYAADGETGAGGNGSSIGNINRRVAFEHMVAKAITKGKRSKLRREKMRIFEKEKIVVFIKFLCIGARRDTGKLFLYGTEMRKIIVVAAENGIKLKNRGINRIVMEESIDLFVLIHDGIGSLAMAFGVGITGEIAGIMINTVFAFDGFERRKSFAMIGLYTINDLLGKSRGNGAFAKIGTILFRDFLKKSIVIKLEIGIGNNGTSFIERERRLLVK